MNIKTKTVEAKADGANGSISGYAATWTREPDSYGDVIAKGAFAESLAAIAESGKAIPLLWNHDSYNLGSYIGTVKALEEDDHGLYFEADFDATDEAQRARELEYENRSQAPCYRAHARAFIHALQRMPDASARASGVSR